MFVQGGMVWIWREDKALENHDGLKDHYYVQVLHSWCLVPFRKYIFISCVNVTVMYLNMILMSFININKSQLTLDKETDALASHT